MNTQLVDRSSIFIKIYIFTQLKTCSRFIGEPELTRNALASVGFTLRTPRERSNSPLQGY